MMDEGKTWLEERSTVLLAASGACSLHTFATAPRANILQHLYVRNVRFVVLPLGVLYASEAIVGRVRGVNDVFNSIASVPLAVTAMGLNQGWRKAVRRGAIWGGLSLTLGSVLFYGEMLEKQQQQELQQQQAENDTQSA